MNYTYEEIVARLQKARTVKILPDGKVRAIRSVRINPMNRIFFRKNVIEPSRRLNYKTLRRIAEKAWLINAIINLQINKTRPFLKVSTKEDVRGFRIKLKDRDAKPSGEDQKVIKQLEDFFLDTGFGKDPDREDKLDGFASKLIRDLLTLDQVTTELQYTKGKSVYAFWAVDPATIYRVTEEGYEGDDAIRFIQEVNMVVTARYTADELLFDYMNPRTDIDHAYYGYSYVEQAIDLITALINTFVYNMGAFTEDKLPRGMLLLSGDADMEEVEAIEEYIIDIMSGGPLSKWRIPIVPSGGEGKSERKLEWIDLRKTNQEMQFAQWTEFLWSSVAALFGVDLEELGIKTQRSTGIFGENVEPRLEASKSRGLGSILTFMAGHFQKILDRIDPKHTFEFLGYEKDDPKLNNEIRKNRLETTDSIDDLRKEEDKKPYNQPWSKIPLNPYVIQLMQMQMQMGQRIGVQDEKPEESEVEEKVQNEVQDNGRMQKNEEYSRNRRFEERKRKFEKSIKDPNVIEIIV